MYKYVDAWALLCMRAFKRMLIKACILYLAQASSETKTGFDLGFARGSREQKANDGAGVHDLYASGSSFAVCRSHLNAV